MRPAAFALAMLVACLPGCLGGVPACQPDQVICSCREGRDYGMFFCAETCPTPEPICGASDDGGTD